MASAEGSKYLSSFRAPNTRAASRKRLERLVDDPTSASGAEVESHPAAGGKRLLSLPQPAITAGGGHRVKSYDEVPVGRHAKTTLAEIEKGSARRLRLKRRNKRRKQAATAVA